MADDSHSMTDVLPPAVILAGPPTGSTVQKITTLDYSLLKTLRREQNDQDNRFVTDASEVKIEESEVKDEIPTPRPVLPAHPAVVAEGPDNVGRRTVSDHDGLTEVEFFGWHAPSYIVTIIGRRWLIIHGLAVKIDLQTGRRRPLREYLLITVGGRSLTLVPGMSVKIVNWPTTTRDGERRTASDLRRIKRERLLTTHPGSLYYTPALDADVEVVDPWESPINAGLEVADHRWSSALTIHGPTERWTFHRHRQAVSSLLDDSGQQVIDVGRTNVRGVVAPINPGRYSFGDLGFEVHSLRPTYPEFVTAFRFLKNRFAIVDAYIAAHPPPSYTRDPRVMSEGWTDDRREALLAAYDRAANDAESLAEVSVGSDTAYAEQKRVFIEEALADADRYAR